MEIQIPEFFWSPQRSNLTIDHGLWLAKEPVREIPDEPHDPEIQPDLPPEPLPNLSPEIPDSPSPEVFPGRSEPEIGPSPEF